MNNFPPATELLASASRFLRDQLLPALSGADAFNLRVSINAIDLVRRELEQKGEAEKREHGRLATLLEDRTSDIDTLRDTLCRKITAGELTLDQSELRNHLRATAIDRLAIDQPTYSAYLAAAERRRGTDTSKNSVSEE
jgi:hypothetical protein